MTSIVTLLTDGFADWETSLLNGAGRGFYKLDTAYASPGGRPVTSMGGMKVVPDLSFDAVDPANFDALVICDKCRTPINAASMGYRLTYDPRAYGGAGPHNLGAPSPKR